MLRFLFIITLFIHHTLSAQPSICGATVPTVICPADTELCANEISGPFTISSSSSLPTIEYLIIDYELPSDAGTGPSVIDIDADGLFAPSDYGISQMQQVGVVPFAYDLPALQETVDDILKGMFIIFDCCDLASEATAICDSLTNNGISCGSDLTSISGISSLFNNGQQNLSMADITAAIDSINVLLNSGIPSACGGGDMLCYAVGNECIFDVIAGPGTNISLSAPAHLSSESILSTGTISSTAMVSAGLSVAYTAAGSISLNPGFEVVQSGTFCAIIEACI